MYQWDVIENADPGELKVIADGVTEHGRSLAFDGHATPIACLVRDNQGVIAGVTGRTEYERLFISHLWVSEAFRSNGMGTELLRKVEHASEQRGCSDALIETLSDKTALFYSRLGYQTVARIPCYVGSFTRYIMIKKYMI